MIVDNIHQYFLNIINILRMGLGEKIKEIE